MRTERQDIRVYRNATYNEGWQLSDVDDAPIDLTGCSLELKVRAVAGQGAVVSAAVFDIYDPANGIFTMRIDGSSFDSEPGQTEVVRLAYDLRLTYPDGTKVIPAAGQILLTPGATY